MIIDKLAEFASATALSTVGTGRALVGDVMDLGSNADLGTGEPLYLVIQVDTTVTSGGAATVSFELVSDAQAALATDGSATEHIVTEDIPVSDLVAGYTRVFPLPPGDYERYLGILQNVGTAALTAGKINAFITHSIQRWKAYPNSPNS